MRLLVGTLIGIAIVIAERALFFAAYDGPLSGKILGASGVVFTATLFGLSFIVGLTNIRVRSSLAAGICLGCVVSSPFFFLNAVKLFSEGG